MIQIVSRLLILMAVEYGCVLFAVALDLAVALRKLHRESAPCTSRGLRRSVTKLSSYYAALLSLTIVDVMLVAATLGMEAVGGKGFFTPFPYLTTLGAVSMVMIELKSISETTGVDVMGIVRLWGRKIVKL